MTLKSHCLVGVRERRQLLGVSAKAIAARLGVTPITYYRFERGERRIYLDYAFTIATFLNCTLEQLGQDPTDDERLELLKRARVRSKAEARGEDPNEEEEVMAIAASFDDRDDGDV